MRRSAHQRQVIPDCHQGHPVAWQQRRPSSPRLCLRNRCDRDGGLGKNQDRCGAGSSACSRSMALQPLGEHVLRNAAGPLVANRPHNLRRPAIRRVDERFDAVLVGLATPDLRSSEADPDGEAHQRTRDPLPVLRRRPDDRSQPRPHRQPRGAAESRIVPSSTTRRGSWPSRPPSAMRCSSSRSRTRRTRAMRCRSGSKKRCGKRRRSRSRNRCADSISTNAG